MNITEGIQVHTCQIPRGDDDRLNPTVQVPEFVEQLPLDVCMILVHGRQSVLRTEELMLKQCNPVGIFVKKLIALVHMVN